MSDEALFYPADLTNGAVTVAASQIGVKETGWNRGPEVDQYIASVGLQPGLSWCACFVHWCFMRAADALEMLNPCPKTAGCLRMWDLANDRAKVRTPTRGAVFIVDKSHGLGHTGIVEDVHGGGLITTIEGNTNEKGSREGNAVARHTWRPQDGARGTIVGYLDFALIPLVSRSAKVLP